MNDDPYRMSRAHPERILSFFQLTTRRASANTRRLGLTTIALAASGSTTLVFNLVLVRALSLDQYGQVAQTFSLGMAVAQLTMAGLSVAIARHVARGQDDEQRFSRARGGISALCISCSTTSLLYFPLAFAGLAPTSVPFLLLGWALAFVYAIYFGIKSMMFALAWSSRYAVLEFLSDVLFFLVLVVLVALVPTAAVLSFSLAYGFFIFIAIRLIARRGNTVEHISINRDIVKFTGWASVATYASVGRFTIAVAFTGALTSSATAGRLAAVLTIIMPLFLIPQAVGVLTFADVARATDDDAGQSVRMMCRVAAWISAFTIITGCLFAQEIVRILLGNRYRFATSEFLILIICIAPQISATPITNALAAQGAVALNAAFSIIAFCAMLIGLIFLVPSDGALGATIAFGISVLITGIPYLFVGHVRFAIGVREIAGTIATVGVGLAILPFINTPLVTRIAAEVLLFVVIPVIWMWIRVRLRTTAVQVIR